MFRARPMSFLLLTPIGNHFSARWVSNRFPHHPSQGDLLVCGDGSKIVVNVGLGAIRCPNLLRTA